MKGKKDMAVTPITLEMPQTTNSSALKEISAAHYLALLAVLIVTTKLI